MNNDDQHWLEIIGPNGINIQDGQLKQLSLYRDLLIEWNSKINLISRKDETNIWPNHILHSISPLFTMNIPDGVSLADIGSGGGLPGVPLAILLPKVKVVMIESIKKKCIALSDMVSRLGIANAQVINGRAEEVGKSKEHRSQFDMIVARAVAPLDELITWSAPLLRKTSAFKMKLRGQEKPLDETIQLPVLISMKGGDLVEEIAEAKRMKACKTIRTYELHFDGIEKTGLVDKKIVIVGL